MTEQKLKLPYDWRKLELAPVAGSYISQGEQGKPLARKALELLLEDIGYANSWLGQTVKDAPLEKAIGNCLGEYSVQNSEQTIGDYLSVNEDVLKKYKAETVDALKKDLGPSMSTKYQEIFNENEKAEHIIKGKEKHNIGSDEEVERAKATTKKYEKVIPGLSIIENGKISKLRDRVETAYNQDLLDSLYSNKKEAE